MPSDLQARSSLAAQLQASARSGEAKQAVQNSPDLQQVADPRELRAKAQGGRLANRMRSRLAAFGGRVEAAKRRKQPLRATRKDQFRLDLNTVKDEFQKFLDLDLNRSGPVDEISRKVMDVISSYEELKIPTAPAGERSVTDASVRYNQAKIIAARVGYAMRMSGMIQGLFDVDMAIYDVWRNHSVRPGTTEAQELRQIVLTVFEDGFKGLMRADPFAVVEARRLFMAGANPDETAARMGLSHPFDYDAFQRASKRADLEFRAEVEERINNFVDDELIPREEIVLFAQQQGIDHDEDLEYLVVSAARHTIINGMFDAERAIDYYQIIQQPSIDAVCSSVR